MTATRPFQASPSATSIAKECRGRQRLLGIGVADGSDGNLVEKNRMSATQVFGIAVFSSSIDNRVEKNDVRGTLLGDGIVVAAQCQRHADHEERRQQQRRRRHRRRIDTPPTTVTAITAHDTSDHGNEAVAGTTDGGELRASGHGNAAQARESAARKERADRVADASRIVEPRQWPPSATSPSSAMGTFRTRRSA